MEPIESGSPEIRTTLLKYLRDPPSNIDGKVPSAITLHNAEQSAMQANITFFEEVYNNSESYGIDIHEFLTWVADCYDNVELITDLIEVSVDDSTVAIFSDIEYCSKEQFVPIYYGKEKKQLILTVRIEEELFKSRIETKLDGRPIKYAICTPKMYAAINLNYIQPKKIALNASRAESTVQRNVRVSESKYESEFRTIYRNIINAGYTSRASDIHFIPQEKDCIILFRVDGLEQIYSSIPKLILDRIYNIMINDSGEAVSNPKIPISAKIRFKLDNQEEIDLRISIIPAKFGPDINVRFLTSKLMSMEELGMFQQTIKTYKSLLDAPQGMVVMVGPTGSGKSTTLYSGLSYIHESLRNIIAIEDPVEILMPGITQIDVVKGSGLDFPQALKATLRHDPDVIVVGEMRDADTAADAVRAANTGHLVISSLHTNDSIGVIERMITLGIEPYALGEVLIAVMGQRLVRRLCPKCKREVILSKDSPIVRQFGLNLKESIKVYEPYGCEFCDGRGYFGRIAVNEILQVDSKLRDLIQTHSTRKNIETYLRKTKFKPMIFDAIVKVVQGLTSFDEISKLLKDVTSFRG